MSTQPEAIRLADELADYSEGPYTAVVLEQAAAELRRLHAENERLHQINQSHEMKLSVRGYEIQIEDLKAVNGELLVALRDLVDAITGRLDGETIALHNALAVIKKAEGV
jgi:hypothetical protein